MIQFVAKVINLFGLTVRNALATASFIGQLIVTLFTSIFQAIFAVVNAIILFLQIIYEDNIFILTEELPNLTNYTLNACTQQWNQVQSFFTDVYSNVSFSVTNTLSKATWTVQAATTVVLEVIILLKKTAIFIGNTLWFILTFIPIQVPLLIRDLMKYLRDVIIEIVIDAYMRLLKITNFLTDVPLESFIGMTSAIIIVRLSIHFREEIQTRANALYWLMWRKCLYYYHVFFNYYMDSEVRAITRLASGEEVRGLPVIEGALEEEDPVDPAEALCVVCQERQKCILILPCRHVCLCRECCIRLYEYQRTCPICRTFIYHSVTIYL